MTRELLSLLLKKKNGKITHPGWFKKDKPVTRSGNSDGKKKNYMMKKKKMASARKIMNLITLESRIYEKLYKLEILIGKTIRLDEGQGNWHNTGLFTLE